MASISVLSVSMPVASTAPRPTVRNLSVPSNSTEFETLVQKAGKPETSPAAARANHAPMTPLVAHEARKVPPLEQFEGFVLRSFVEEMLPSKASTYFGTGTAGAIWRSMLAEHIGDELARGGGIGIAAAIAGKPSSGFSDRTALAHANEKLSPGTLASIAAAPDQVQEPQ